MSVFVAAFPLFWLASVYWDYRRWKNREVKNVNKPLFVSLNAGALLLYIAYAANVHVPMPTHFFLRYVAPWVKMWIKGTYHA